jgi:hypothetical protein
MKKMILKWIEKVEIENLDLRSKNKINSKINNNDNIQNDSNISGLFDNNQIQNENKRFNYISKFKNNVINDVQPNKLKEKKN